VAIVGFRAYYRNGNRYAILLVAVFGGLSIFWIKRYWILHQAEAFDLSLIHED